MSSSYHQEVEPTEVCTATTGHAVVVERDKLTVRYTGDGRHSNDVGAVQSNWPVPKKRMVYYYEVTVLDEGTRSKIAVGFADKQFKLNRQPGWEPNSYGYHGDDGKKFHQAGMGEDYGPKFGTGDVIGAGIHLNKGEMFFTKNGVKLKTAFRNVRGTLYPTVGLHSKNECVEINFGAKPFKFDLQGLIAEEIASQQAAINKAPVPVCAPLALVADYLEHCAYGQTLDVLRREADLEHVVVTPPPPPAPDDTTAATAGEPSAAAAAAQPTDQPTDMDTCAPSSQPATSTSQPRKLATRQERLRFRQRIRQLLLVGDVDQAIQMISTSCPQVLQMGTGFDEFRYQLYRQKFIEMVRARKVSEAMQWAQQALSPVREALPHVEATLRDTVALLAYEHPESCPLALYMSLEQRQWVADYTNCALLCAVEQKPIDLLSLPQPGLARVVKQVLTVHETTLELNGGQGEPLELQTVLLGRHGAGRKQADKEQPAPGSLTLPTPMAVG